MSYIFRAILDFQKIAHTVQRVPTLTAPGSPVVSTLVWYTYYS